MIETSKALDFTENEHETVWFQKRICVPDVDRLREKILKKAHDSAYSIHPGSTKMYQDLKERYWWYGMKRDVAAHVALCDVCHRVKVEHQRPASLLQPLKVPEWKWEEGEFVSMKVSPIRGLSRFKVKGKLSPRYIGPFKILELKGEVAY
jgi:hypothetical protein